MPRYTKAAKEAAIAMVVSGTSMRQVSEVTGIARNTLRSWLDELKPMSASQLAGFATEMMLESTKPADQVRAGRLLAMALRVQSLYDTDPGLDPVDSMKMLRRDARPN